MWKNIILVAVLVGAFIIFSWFRSSGTVSGTEARRLVEGGATLLDVRTTSEFASGHISGAINIPVHTLADRLEELGDRNEPIVVYCRSGGRSARAQRLLEKAGFAKVSDLGGIGRW